MTKSRGIGRGSRPTHGHSRRALPTTTYNSWRGMIERCKPHKQYGRLGIKVCKRWSVFSNFLEDMGVRPAGTEIDRLDPLGDYERDNCMWTVKRPNRQYRRTTKLTEERRAEASRLRADGLSYREIARRLEVSKTCISAFFTGASWRDPGQPPPNQQEKS